MRIAFKEWAIVEEALATGRQILIFRKGGISEGGGGFKLEHDRFLIFPTLFHQQRQAVIDDAQRRYDEIAATFPAPDTLRIRLCCEITDWREVKSLEIARRLDPFHIWRPNVIADRFEWGRQKLIFAMLVRAYRLANPIELPMSPAYGGCKSWIELERDIDTTGASPVLSDLDFNSRAEKIRAALI